MHESQHEETVVTGDLSIQSKPISAYREDHLTHRLFVLATLIAIVITLIGAFVTMSVNAAHHDIVSIIRELASIIITGLIGVLAGASLRR